MLWSKSWRNTSIQKTRLQLVHWKKERTNTRSSLGLFSQFWIENIIHRHDAESKPSWELYLERLQWVCLGIFFWGRWWASQFKMIFFLRVPRVKIISKTHFFPLRVNNLCLPSRILCQSSHQHQFRSHILGIPGTCEMDKIKTLLLNVRQKKEQSSQHVPVLHL